MRKISSNILHRHPHTALRTAAGGEGPYLFDSTGAKYLDGSGGAAVSCLGHNHPAVVEAMRAQLARLSYAHTAFFTTEILEQLGAHLIAHAPANFSHAYFVSGGSEAMETALKLARQYCVEIGQPQRTMFISRAQSYHGSTLGALAVGGHARRRALYEPLLFHSAQIPPCYAYRYQRADESADEYGIRAADELDRKINAIGANKVIGFIAEPVVGATAGAVPAVRGYFQRIREICDRYGVLLILDEVMCGLGRTGDLYAHSYDGIRADLVTLAKGLGGGYQPIGATLVDERIYAAIAGGRGAFEHGHTYIGHAVAAAAALAVQETIQNEGLLYNVRQRGAELMEGLRSQFADHPHIGDIRGRGLFIGLELVQDRARKTPFGAATPLHILLKKTALEHGLMIYPDAGTADGVNGHHILLAPAFIFTAAQVEELTHKLARTLQCVFKQIA